MITVGVLGGSFDPVHLGHIELACQARRFLGLEQVLLLPCSDPPHKPERALAARYHRLEMLYLALEDWPGIDVSTIEIARGGLCYTIDTLRALRNGVPAYAPVFLCGSDALADVTSWREHAALVAEFDFASVVRPDDAGRSRDPVWPNVVAERVSPIPLASDAALGTGGRVFRLDIPALAMSSSTVRSSCAAGRPVVELVPARVARYIQRHRLYSKEAPR